MLIRQPVLFVLVTMSGYASAGPGLSGEVPCVVGVAGLRTNPREGVDRYALSKTWTEFSIGRAMAVPGIVEGIIREI